MDRMQRGSARDFTKIIAWVEINEQLKFYIILSFYSPVPTHDFQQIFFLNALGLKYKTAKKHFSPLFLQI